MAHLLLSSHRRPILRIRKLITYEAFSWSHLCLWSHLGFMTKARYLCFRERLIRTASERQNSVFRLCGISQTLDKLSQEKAYKYFYIPLPYSYKLPLFYHPLQYLITFSRTQQWLLSPTTLLQLKVMHHLHPTSMMLRSLCKILLAKPKQTNQLKRLFFT